MIKVLHLISTKAFLGAERVICEILKKNNSNNITMSLGILTSSGDIIKRFHKEIGRTDIVILKFGGSEKLSFNTVKRISNYIQENSINIVHSHNYKSDFYAFICKLIIKNKLHLIASNHTWKLNTIREYGYKWLDSLIMKKFDGLIAISSEIKDEMIRAGINKSKIKIILNGVDCEEHERSLAKTEARARLELGENDFIVGCVASLTPEKGHMTLLKAFSEVHTATSEIKLCLVGEGPERNKIENYIYDNKLSETVFLKGSRADIRELYKGFDVFILPSYQEGLPMVLLESMASGVPVIVTYVGAIPEIIQNNQNGIIIEPGNIGQMAQAILEINSNKEIRGTIRKNALKTVKEKYSSDLMTEEYQQIYKEVFLLGSIR